MPKEKENKEKNREEKNLHGNEPVSDDEMLVSCKSCWRRICLDFKMLPNMEGTPYFGLLKS